MNGVIVAAASRRPVRAWPGTTRWLSIFLSSVFFSVWVCAFAIAAEEQAQTMAARADLAYERGDVADALRWYRKAAELGSAHAQARLGFILDQAGENDDALAWYQRAAQLGSPAGQHGLARMYLAGEAVSADAGQALYWMQKAAAQDYLPSLLGLARALETGAAGIDSDASASLKYWRRAAELGDHSAMLRVARAYRLGELGVAIDDKEAKRWERAFDEATSGAAR